MTTRRNSNGVPVVWDTTESEARHWRQFCTEELRQMVIRRSQTIPAEAIPHDRGKLIRALEAYGNGINGKSTVAPDFPQDFKDCFNPLLKDGEAA